jgi:hypothetical protein
MCGVSRNIRTAGVNNRVTGRYSGGVFGPRFAHLSPAFAVPTSIRVRLIGS